MRASLPYLSGAMAATFSFAASGIAGIVSLYFLVQILSKEDFGAYSFAVNVMILAALLATLGLERALLLRLAPLHTPEGKLLGRSVFWRTCRITTLAAALIGAAIWGLVAGSASWVTADLGSWWIAALVPSLLPMAVLALARAWFQANHRTGDAAVMPGIADASRAAMIASVFALGLGKAGIAAAFCLSSMLPLAILWARARGKSEAAPADLSRSDIQRGLVYSLQRIADIGLYLIDIIIIGLVATDVVTAEYALAARLAAMTDLGRLAMTATFTPRARLHHHANNTTALAREYRKARLSSYAVACCVTVALLLFGSAVLTFFGDFAVSFGPMLVLASGYLFNAASGLHASYLAMTGEVMLSAVIRIVGLTGAVLGLTFLTPQFGSMGAAIVITAAMSGINAMSMLLLWRRTGFRAFGLWPMLVGAGSAALLCAVAATLLSPGWASCAILAGLLLLVWQEWPRQTAAGPGVRPS